MRDYLVPTNPDFIEEIAKSIARSRMMSDASGELEQIAGIRLEDNELLESEFDNIFETLWNTAGSESDSEKAKYRSDAEAAIRAINLKLITAID
jgi:hypothetical protein